SYRVQVSASSAFSTTVVDQSGLPAVSNAITGLHASTAYYWRVNATNSAGTSAWSGSFGFTTVSGPPPVTVWKLVSLPVTAADPRTTVLFPTAISSAYAYNQAGGLTATDVLSNGVGYWIKFGADQTTNFQGTPILSDTVDVQSGWNLIGSISSSIPVSAVSSLPPNITTSNFFTYRNGYEVSQTIDRGNGYWVKVTQAGKLVLSSSSAATSANRVIISLTGETPPPPPEDVMSVGSGETPRQYALAQNFPNPFNPTTAIQFDLPRAGHATLKVYNTLGEEVASLVGGDLPAGSFQAVWNASGMPSGTYFYRLISGDFSQIRKLVLMK
ncbi:MAG: T9SS type A sorting domain-containing protein, partial [Ignavibacteria bacterium]